MNAHPEDERGLAAAPVPAASQQPQSGLPFVRVLSAQAYVDSILVRLWNSRRERAA